MRTISEEIQALIAESSFLEEGLARGIINCSALAREMQPRIETNYVSVEVPFLGATPLDVEEGVVIKIEEAIQDIEGIEEIISTASRGYGNVTIEVNADYEVTEVMDEVKNRVDAISTFPALTEKPVIYKQCLDILESEGHMAEDLMGQEMVQAQAA